ncbi:helix-turn-helix domain-containing protein [Brevibacillus reuszeri]|uniref:helix-turn-helix domain-containing protein n=1 Tax=Brevibacillus reuszeri TaxID=54915 RepID=UPI000CCBF64F|nr:helix-turn-helix domain-containing protein [Brevibacillus reuszeri]
MSMGNKISLRDARENADLSIREVSKLTAIPKEQLEKWEDNPAILPLHSACVLLKLYRISFNHVFFGKDSEAQASSTNR